MKITEPISEAEAKKLVAEDCIEPTQVSVNYEGTGFAPTVKVSISGLVDRYDEEGDHIHYETFYTVEELIDDDYLEEGHVDSQEACMDKVSERLALLGYKLGPATNKRNTYYSVLPL